MTDFSCFKTCRPHLQQIYPRERLHARLDRCLERPLVWIAAPGGSGKSTLVAHYLELRGLPTFWYRVDGHDDDGVALFRHLGNLVASPESIRPHPPALECHTPDVVEASRSWFREFFSIIPTPTVFVFADVHNVGNASAFHTVLACCLEELPDTCRVIVISRENLPPVLSGYHYRGLVHDLTWDDLRVTPEEAVGIAGTILEEEVDEHSVRQLHIRSNGWMAGLLLCLRHGIPSPELLLPGTANTPVSETSPRRLKIHTLGRFELCRDGAPVILSCKAPKKPLEMLKILVANGGRGVATGVFIETLWPDAVGDAAVNTLTTTLQRLRHLLGSEKVIRVHQGEVSLDVMRVWVDAWEFEELLTQSQEALCQGDEAQADALIRQAVALYQGHFLLCDSDKSWSFAYRERLRGKFTHHVGVLCRRLDEQGETHQAIACYRDGLEIDHLTENFYQQLMLCYHQTGLHAEAAIAYTTCRKNLAIHLGIAPSPRTEEIYRMIRDHKASLNHLTKTLSLPHTSPTIAK